MSAEAQATLGTVLQNVSAAWDEVRGHWRDAKCAEFEERYLKDLPGRTAEALNVIAEIDKLLKKVKSDRA